MKGLIPSIQLHLHLTDTTIRLQLVCDINLIRSFNLTKSSKMKLLRNPFLVAVVLIVMAGCRKDGELVPGERLPFSNGIFRLELVSTNLPDETINVHFFNNSEGIAMTSDGNIFKTLDAGNTWKLTYSMSGFPPFVKSLFINDDIGF